MPVLQLIIVLVIAGVIMWLVNSYLPMQRGIKTILNVVVVIAALIYVMAAFGLLGPSAGIWIGRR
jgi:hypothetical protein